MADITVKQNDVGTFIERFLEEYDEATSSWVPIPLVGDETIRLLMKSDASNPSVSLAGTMAIVDIPTSRVRYVWAAGDLQYAGSYRAECEIARPDGSVETVPNGGDSATGAYFTVDVIAELG